MKLIFMLFLTYVVLNLDIARARQRVDDKQSSIVRAVNQTQKQKSEEWRIKRPQIQRQSGLDGKVTKIHLDSEEEDKPGIRVYGLPKKRLENNGVIERVQLGADRFDETLRNSRLMKRRTTYKLSKDRAKMGSFIEKLSSATTTLHSASQNERIRLKRFINGASKDKIEGKIEVEDMEAQEAKVFRPLFVYRQQMAARRSRKHAKNLAHRNHWHATHQFCKHRSAVH